MRRRRTSARSSGSARGSGSGSARADFEKEFGRPYPAAQRGADERPDVERGREAVNDSL